VGGAGKQVPGYEPKMKQYLPTACNEVPTSLCGQKSSHIPSSFRVLATRKLLTQIFVDLLWGTFLSRGAAREAEIPHPKLRIEKLGLGSPTQYYIRPPANQSFN